jgi:hypothetical protein
MIDDIRPKSGPQDKKTPTDLDARDSIPEDFQEDTSQLDDLFVGNEEGSIGVHAATAPLDKPSAAPKAKQNNRVATFFQKLRPRSKKQWIIAVVAVLVVVGGGSAGAYALLNHPKKAPVVSAPAPVAKKEEPPKPTTEASKLTGVEVDPALNKRPVTAIMIENSPDARPQSGLNQAGVVFEAIAEGGITRFLTLFQEAQPDYIGPVRSVRPYYAQLEAPFDAALAHAGGSGDGLAMVKSLGIKDLDFGANGSTYQRVSSRYAPHNLYTTMADLDKASQGHGFTSSSFTGYLRKKEAPSAAPTAKTIDLTMSGILYNPHYDYDAATNSYKRSEGGKPHTDERSGAQLAPKVVVALVMSYSQNGIYSVYQTTGSGQMVVFQDGTVQKGTWSRSGVKDMLSFTDEAGKPLALNPGQTWFTLVATSGAVKYAP